VGGVGSQEGENGIVCRGSRVSEDKPYYNPRECEATSRDCTRSMLKTPQRTKAAEKNQRIQCRPVRTTPQGTGGIKDVAIQVWEPEKRVSEERRFVAIRVRGREGRHAWGV